MIVNGFPARALVTICTPHLGLGAWVPTPTPGPASISPNSDDLAELNRKDGPHRHNYYAFGMTKRDSGGYLRDDGMVPIESALGQGLGMRYGEETILNYHNIAGVDPHMQGMNPKFTGAALRTCGTLLRNL
jgi:hypothetical protein